MERLSDWIYNLFPKAIAIARNEHDGARNSDWWKTPVRGHNIEVMILLINGFQDLLSAEIAPDGNNYVLLKIPFQDAEPIISTWGVVSQTPGGIQVRLPIRAETTIGAVVQAALYSLFYVLSVRSTEPFSFDVRYKVGNIRLGGL